MVLKPLGIVQDHYNFKGDNRRDFFRRDFFRRNMKIEGEVGLKLCQESQDERLGDKEKTLVTVFWCE